MRTVQIIDISRLTLFSNLTASIKSFKSDSSFFLVLIHAFKPRNIKPPPNEAILSNMKEGDNGMPAKWTADLLGEMHLAGVTAKQLAAEVGWNPKYLSVVLNGHKEPKGAEQKLNEALERLKSKF